MIVKFARDGTSAKGLLQYLMNGPDHAKTSERVGFTHTFNIVNTEREHISSAVHEIVSTYLNADALRAEAGVSGPRPDKSIKHVSLSWHPSEVVDRAEMIRAADEFLKAMGWRDGFQVILVSHTDKQPHIHLAISKLNIETGKALNDSFCRRRAQRFALAYEQSRGKVWCAQRLLPAEQREAAPPRPVWELLDKGEQAFRRAETARLADAPQAEIARREGERYEHKALRELHKEARLAFFDEGKSAYKQLRSDLYREVRKAFRKEWAGLYRAEQDGVGRSQLAALKADLIARQTIALELSRDSNLNALRAERDGVYRELLDRQKVERAELVARQERGVPSIDRLRDMAETPPAPALIATVAAERAEEEARHRRNEADRASRIRWPANGGGMVAQQSAAMRWLQAAARGAEQQPRDTPDRGMTPAQAWLYGKRATVASSKDRKRDGPERGRGIEPD